MGQIHSFPSTKQTNSGPFPRPVHPLNPSNNHFPGACRALPTCDIILLLLIDYFYCISLT